MLTDLPRVSGLKFTRKRSGSVDHPPQGGIVQWEQRAGRSRGDARSSPKALGATTKGHQVSCHCHTLHRRPNRGSSLRRDLLVGFADATAVTSGVDGRSLQQWRSIQGKYWLELQKVQHSIQQTLEQYQDPGREPRGPSPTAMEQMKDRIRSNSQDEHILNGSCGEEMVRSSLTRARRSARKKRRRAQRKRVRPVKQACSDTNEETSSSTDEAVSQRKRARFYKESSPCPIIHIRTDTSLHLHVTTFRFHDSSSHGTWHHERAIIHCFVTHSLRLKTDDNHDSSQPPPALALLNNMGSRRVRRSSSGRSEKSGSRFTRQKPGGSRTTHRQPQTYQRSWRLWTPSREEFKTCKYQMRRRYKPLVQPQHRLRCPTLEDLPRRGRNSSPERILVRSVAQIPPPSEQTQSLNNRFFRSLLCWLIMCTGLLKHSAQYTLFRLRHHTHTTTGRHTHHVTYNTTIQQHKKTVFHADVKA